MTLNFRRFFSLFLVITTVLILGIGNVIAEGLNERLQQLSEKSKEGMPPDKVAVMERSLAELKVSNMIEQAPQVGQSLPDATLLDVNGSSKRLFDVIGDKSAIVTFYRGGWCPYCNLQLHAYSIHLEEIESLGATLVAISPELPDQSLTTKQKNDLKFGVLSDKNNQYARSLKIVFELNNDLKALYTEFGISLEKNQGNDSSELPLAATFVIDRNRVIRYAFVDVDYKKRAEPAMLISMLKEIGK